MKITVEQFNKLTKPKKRSKYGNKKTTIDGIKFDSKKEAERWLVLQSLEQAGKIRDLRRQVRYSLMVNHKLICAYVADFVYYQGCKASEVVEDVKSDATRKLPVYVMKKKLMAAIHGIEIKEV
jgi:hypothetical protein